MSSVTETLDRPAEVRSERTGDIALTAWQVAYEQRAFWRNRTRAFFSFGMPVMLLLLFGALTTAGGSLSWATSPTSRSSCRASWPTGSSSPSS
jgi:hypothetical protein